MNGTLHHLTMNRQRFYVFTVLLMNEQTYLMRKRYRDFYVSRVLLRKAEMHYLMRKRYRDYMCLQYCWGISKCFISWGRDTEIICACSAVEEGRNALSHEEEIQRLYVPAVLLRNKQMLYLMRKRYRDYICLQYCWGISKCFISWGRDTEIICACSTVEE